jgi:hypothetical protein
MTPPAPRPHPEPPDDLNARDPLIACVDHAWFRVYNLRRGPLFFGRGTNHRFNAPGGEFGVLYIGADEHCAFIETLGQETGCRIVTTAELLKRGWARVLLSRPLCLIDLVRSGGLARIGADARLFAGEHSVSQRWSKALWDHHLRPDGILYPARHDPARKACALYDHCEALVTAAPLGCLGDPKHSALLGNILDTYGFELIDA